MNAYTGAMGFPVNMPANFAPSGNAANAMRGPTPSQLANHNNPPMQTLYVRNLKAKRKAASMKEILKKKFKEHGTVTCVQVARTNRMRGQAFVSFDNVNEAMAAKDALDGQELDGLRIVVQFAKDKSDKLAKKDGTYVKRSQAEVKVSDKIVTITPPEREDRNRKQPWEPQGMHPRLFSLLCFSRVVLLCASSTVAEHLNPLLAFPPSL